MRSLRRWLVIGCLSLWGCSSDSKDLLSIGVDPSWYPLNFEAQNSYVNGFVDDMLLEMAWHAGIEWEKVLVDSDSLLQGLASKKYDAVLTSLPRYVFHLAKYDFSENFLDLGPVLIVKTSSKYTTFSQIKNGTVGVLAGEPLAPLVDAKKEVRFRAYPQMVDLLTAIAAGEVVGGVVGQLAAAPYLKDLFAKELKAVGNPLTDEGLHLIVLKDQNKKLMDSFASSLEWFKKKKQADLLKKWSLTKPHSIQ